MNFLQLTLRRPMTVIVLVIAAVLGGVLAIQRMSRDIFPPLGIPTIYVAQPYGGMDPAQMEGYLTYRYEYHFLYITGIEHVESKSIQGASIMKLQFHPGTDMAQAMSETVAQVNRSRAFMPPGTVAPFVMRFDAGSVAVGNLVFSTTNPDRTLGEMQDLALNRVRPAFATLYYITDKFEAVFRYSYVDSDGRGITLSDGIRSAPSGGKMDKLSEFYLGANYYIKGQDLKFQLGVVLGETEDVVLTGASAEAKAVGLRSQV
jgi:hypothetical protein